MPPASQPEQAISVSELTARIKTLVEREFPAAWVSGEVSNCSRPKSGHMYFTLKDANAQIRAVIWRGVASRLKFEMADGLDVLCHGHVDVYPPQGSYQLIIDSIQPKGMGALELALRQLREKLAAEGLFDKARKRPLPVFPRRIAFVTSPTGAAIHDFLEVLRRRWMGTDVWVIPARVQGAGAAKEIVEGIRLANRVKPAPDVLVVGRGGGSLEDLWAFNEEPVVRAIAASRIPTVSAVGHEIDVTLSDLAADVRALTPTEAAERVVPSRAELDARVHGLGQHLGQATRRYSQTARSRLESLASRRAFRRPFDLVQTFSRRLDDASDQMGGAIRRLYRDRQNRFTILAGKLESLSPLGVLERGYSITQDAEREGVIRDASKLKVGQRIVTRFASGQATSTVVSKEDLPRRHGGHRED